MESANTAAVQQVTKKSSDELLKKFSDQLGSDSKKDSCIDKRRRRSGALREGDNQHERRSLLPSMRNRKSARIRQIGIGRTKISSRDIQGTNPCWERWRRLGEEQWKEHPKFFWKSITTDTDFS